MGVGLSYMCRVRSNFGFRVAGFGFRVSGFGFRIFGFGLRVSGSGFRVSGFGFRVSGFGARAATTIPARSALEPFSIPETRTPGDPACFRVEVLGCRVQGSGFRV